MRFLTGWLILGCCSLMGDVANGDFSLTRDRIVPERVFRVGDHVQIDIVESSESSFSENASGSKDTEWEATLAKWIRIKTTGNARQTLKPSALDAPEIDVESEQSFENSSSDSRTSSFRESISCMIKDIRPNGNAFVEGYKEFRDGEKYRKLIFSGEISKEDLKERSSIPSTRVYLPSIEIVEKGPHKDAVKRTFLQWFLQVVWPF